MSTFIRRQYVRTAFDAALDIINRCNGSPQGSASAFYNSNINTTFGLRAFTAASYSSLRQQQRHRAAFDSNSKVSKQRSTAVFDNIVRLLQYSAAASYSNFRQQLVRGNLLSQYNHHDIGVRPQCTSVCQWRSTAATNSCVP